MSVIFDFSCLPFRGFWLHQIPRCVPEDVALGDGKKCTALRFGDWMERAVNVLTNDGGSGNAQMAAAAAAL